MDEFNLEQNHLNETLSNLKEKKKTLLYKLDHIGEISNPDFANSLANDYIRQIENINKNINSPFFARLRYKDDLEIKLLWIGEHQSLLYIMILKWDMSVILLQAV